MPSRQITQLLYSTAVVYSSADERATYVHVRREGEKKTRTTAVGYRELNVLERTKCKTKRTIMGARVLAIAHEDTRDTNEHLPVDPVAVACCWCCFFPGRIYFCCFCVPGILLAGRVDRCLCSESHTHERRYKIGRNKYSSCRDNR